MYCRYAEKMGWKVEIMSQSESDNGGYKEVIALISGDKVYSRLKFESGTPTARSACPPPNRRAASTFRRHGRHHARSRGSGP